MKTTNKFLALLLAAAILLTLAACSSSKNEAATTTASSSGTASSTSAASSAAAASSSEATSSAGAASSASAAASSAASSTSTTVKNIGIAIYSMQADSCVALVNDAQAAADKLGWTITLLDANGDPATQADQMNTLIAKKVDAIILNPTDVASLKPSIEAAKEAGIPVFGVGMEMNDECMSMLLSFAGLDDYNLALAGGKWIAEKYNGKGAEVALITGVAATDPTTKTINALQAAIKDTDIKFDGSYEGKFDAATAMSITEDLLVSNPGLDVIFCQDHVMAGGAASAIADAGKTGKIAVVCVMGMKDYLSYIKDGAIDCAAFVLIEKCGGFAINSLNDYWNGTTLATKYYLDPLMVTADNVDGASDQEFNFSPAT